MAASIRGFGLGVGSKPRIPSDFSLGPLESARPAAKDERAALTTAQAFMKCLAEGKLDPSLLLPEAQDALAALLAPRPSASGAAAPSSQSAAGSGSDRQPGQPAPKKAEAPSPRLGAIAIHGDDASLRVRLPSDPQSPRQEGLLSLRRVADAWYVEALSLDPPSSEALAFSPDPGAQAR